MGQVNAKISINDWTRVASFGLVKIFDNLVKGYRQKFHVSFPKNMFSLFGRVFPNCGLIKLYHLFLFYRTQYKLYSILYSSFNCIVYTVVYTS